jgi:hypothetical protein
MLPIGELQGEAMLVPGRPIGGSVKLLGRPGSYVSVPFTESLKFTGDVSLEAWAYITSAPAEPVSVVGKGIVTGSYSLVSRSPEGLLPSNCGGRGGSFRVA